MIRWTNGLCRFRLKTTFERIELFSEENVSRPEINRRVIDRVDTRVHAAAPELQIGIQIESHVVQHLRFVAVSVEYLG